MACQSLGEPGCTQAQVTQENRYHGPVWERMPSQDGLVHWKREDEGSMGKEKTESHLWPFFFYTWSLWVVALYLIILSVTAKLTTSLWKFELTLLLTLFGFLH